MDVNGYGIRLGNTMQWLLVTVIFQFLTLLHSEAETMMACDYS